MKKNAWLWWIAAALAVQVAGLGWLVVRYEQLVANGTEVRIPCGAFDPVDVLRGRYLHVSAQLPCREFTDREGKRTDEWPFTWQEQRRLHALLDPDGSGEASHRVARLALEPDGEGLWVKVSGGGRRWNPETREYEDWGHVDFPGKLFLDERLAGAADKAFRQRGEKKAVAVYRAWKGQIVIADVELDGISVREWARRARAGAAE